MRRFATIFFASFALCGCTSFQDWANTHLPTIGTPCEHWQCFTESGRQVSDINKQEREQREAAEAAQGRQQPAENPAPAPIPAPAAQAAPAAPTAAAAPAKAPTPFDMTPDQLSGLPAPESPGFR